MLLLLLLLPFLFRLCLYPRTLACLLCGGFLVLLLGGSAFAFLLAIVAGEDVVVIVIEVGLLGCLVGEVVVGTIDRRILAFDLGVSALLALLLAASLQRSHQAATKGVVCSSIFDLGLVCSSALGRNGLAELGFPVVVLGLLVALLLWRHCDVVGED